jgi:LysR family transcriptional regulator, nod-box dependent transcriptional activator
MRLDRFDLNLLLVLQIMLEERSVSRAAKRLHLGQSGASGALARLREHFEDELLVPMGRAMVLTPLAQSLIDPVNDTLSRARSTIARKATFNPTTTSRHFSIAASDYVSTVLLTNVARLMAAEAPNLILDIRSPMRDVFERFDAGQIDLLIMPEQYLRKLDAPQVRIFEDSYSCILWEENKFAEETLDIDTYLSLRHVTINFSDDRNLAFEEWFFAKFGRKRKIQMSVDNFGVLPSMIIGTQRAATLHSRQASHFAERYPLRLLPLPFELPPIVETMAWPRYLESDTAHQWLREIVLAKAVELKSC